MSKVGCCGKGASIKKSKNQAFASGSLSQEVDMSDSSLVEYVGRRSVGSSFNAYGFATGTQYRVKVGTPFPVANADLISSKKEEGILQKYEGNKFMFVLVEAEEQEPAPETIVEEQGVVEVQAFSEGTSAEIEIFSVGAEGAELILGEAIEEEPFDFSVADTNLTALKASIRDSGYSITELHGLLAYERSRQNRQGGISAIELAIEELQSNE